MKQIKQLLKAKQRKPSKSSQHSISPGKPVNTAGPDADPGAGQSHPSSDQEVDHHSGLVAALDEGDGPGSQVSFEDTITAGRELPPLETGTTSVAIVGSEHGAHPSGECFRSFRLGLVFILAFASRPVLAEGNGDNEGQGIGSAEGSGGACQYCDGFGSPLTHPSHEWSAYRLIAWE